jgi:hypothetical protein
MCSTSPISNRLGTTLLSSSGLMRHSCRKPGWPAPVMASFTCSLMSSINWRTVASSISAFIT